MHAERNIDEFPATLGRCLLGMAIAIVLGCFIGYGLLLLIGQDTDLTVSNRYMDRLYACRAGFMEQGMEYQQAADALRFQPGMRVLRTASGKPMYWKDGKQIEPKGLIGEEFSSAIESLFLNSKEALAGEEDLTQEPIEDLLLYHISVDEAGRVFYFLYYDPYGYICIVYDEQNSCAEDSSAVLIMDQWYLLFEYEDVAE